MEYKVVAETKYHVRRDYTTVATFTTETDALRASTLMNQAHEAGIELGVKKAAAASTLLQAAESDE
jgi:1,2-phenylacetyl-CoA epoxidase catalytic subunit